MTQEQGDHTVEPLPRPAPPGRRWLPWLLLSVVFVSGVLIGGAAVVIFGHDVAPRKRKSIEEMCERLTGQITAELELSDRQKAQVRQVVQDRLTEIRKIQQEVRPRMERQADLLDQGIRPILTADQIPKWKSLYAKFRERWFPPFPSTQPEQ